MDSIFFEITIIISLAAFLSIVFRLLKQPPLFAYILTGIIIGPFGQLQLQNQNVLSAMGDFGIVLLLFILGLEFKLKEIKAVGKNVTIIGFLQLLITGGLAYLLALGLGFPKIDALYTSIALSFSSTIIIVTILSDKKDLNSLHGKLAIGLLLVQDLCAIVVLMLMSGSSGFNVSENFFGDLSTAFAKGILVFAFLFILSKTLLPKILHIVSHSLDGLFLFSLSWVLILSGFVSSSLIGFPIAIGGFLAGFSLANLPESVPIAARVRTLRDFFITIFFVNLGMQMGFNSLSTIFFPSLVLILFVLLVKPFIVMLIMGFLGYRRRTSFLTSISTAQISEFSLVIVFLGYKLGNISSKTSSTIVLVGIVTFVLSTYGLVYAKKLYSIFKDKLIIFERNISNIEQQFDKSASIATVKDHIVIIGANRIGESILRALEDKKENVVIIDFNPDVIANLEKRGFLHVFGDISDFEIQEKAKLESAALIVSTIADKEDNMSLLSNVARAKKRAKIVLIGNTVLDAKALYKAGADYVVLPHLIGGIHLANIIKNGTKELDKMREKDKALLSSG